MKKIYGLLASTLMLTACDFDGNNGETYELPTTTTSSEMVIIDFEEFNTGAIVSTITPAIGTGTIDVFGVNPDFPDQNTAMIFDSSNPTGDDFDLGTPNFSFGGPGTSDVAQPSNDVALGNVLIISQDLDSSDPDDSWNVGTQYNLDFSNYTTGTVTMYGFDLIDLDDPARGETVVKLLGADGTTLLEQTLTPGENNAKQFVDLAATTGVARMELLFQNSGAIDNIKIGIDTTIPDCAVCTGSVSDLVLKYNGSKAAAVQVYQFSIATGLTSIYDNTVNPGESFAITGANVDGTFGRRIVVAIDGQSKVMFNTSCDMPIGPNLTRGDFEIVSGTSSEGGNLCPIKVPDCGPCDGGVTTLTLRYEGFHRNTKKAAKVVVYQKIKGKKTIIFNKKVAPGEEFTINGGSKNGTFGHQVWIKTNGKYWTKLFTGCQCPIGFGYDCSGYELVSGESKNGGNLCPVEDSSSSHNW